MQATRQQILDFIRRHRRATVRNLDTFLHLTSTGVRQHLTVLEREGLITAHEERGRVGRPALVYELSPKGDALYPKSYDQLANALLDEVRALTGQGEPQRGEASHDEPQRGEPQRGQLQQRLYRKYIVRRRRPRQGRRA